MAKSVLNASHFQIEKAAFDYVEAKLWPNGPTCPHCGNADEKRIGRLNGKTTRLGLRKCYDCKKPFTVRQKTIFESSHLPLHLWLQVIHLMCASKKGISTNQIQRMLSCSMKTAWFLTHRIRAAMAAGTITPMGSDGGTVEIDETYIGDKELVTKRTKKGKSGHSGKRIVVSLVERNGGARSFHVSQISKIAMSEIIEENLHPKSNLNTDESRLYSDALLYVDQHESVYHTKGEYVRGTVHTNTVEGFFSIFKRGMKGVYQHCSEKHLHRYLAEFDFRYSNRMALGIGDIVRADFALEGVKGKRLTYQTTTSV